METTYIGEKIEENNYLEVFFCKESFTLSNIDVFESILSIVENYLKKGLEKELNYRQEILRKEAQNFGLEDIEWEIPESSFIKTSDDFPTKKDYLIYKNNISLATIIKQRIDCQMKQIDVIEEKLKYSIREIMYLLLLKDKYKQDFSLKNWSESTEGIKLFLLCEKSVFDIFRSAEKFYKLESIMSNLSSKEAAFLEILLTKIGEESGKHLNDLSLIEEEVAESILNFRNVIPTPLESLDKLILFYGESNVLKFLPTFPEPSMNKPIFRTKKKQVINSIINSNKWKASLLILFSKIECVYSRCLFPEI